MHRLTALAMTAIIVAAAIAQDAAQTQPTSAQLVAARAAELRQRGAAYLLAAQDKDGGWAGDTGPGVTCLVLKALIQEPSVGPDHPAVQRALEFLRRFERDDGGVYIAEGLHKNYETSVALLVYTQLDTPHARQRLRAAQQFLKQLQWDEDEEITPDNPRYGGAGYGHGKRPDLSNTQFMLEALHESGLPQDDPAYRKALIFISRCQMLGETNDQKFARGSHQGGFIYSPVNGGESKAGTFAPDDADRELRCYGSMTYAGFKSMLYCGLTADDARVKAALDWMRSHWTLDYNPNMPDRQSKEGLYYYLHTFSRALTAFDQPVIRDNQNRPHNWREELVHKLATAQQQDGSWINPEDRWMEGLPPLTTAYAMLALQSACPSR